MLQLRTNRLLLFPLTCENLQLWLGNDKELEKEIGFNIADIQLSELTRKAYKIMD